VSVIPTMAKQIHVPIIGDSPVVWSDELDDLSANAPDGDDLVLTAQKVGTVVTLSNESATDDSSGAVLNSTGDALVGAVARASR
jgi:hypothetical protein